MFLFSSSSSSAEPDHELFLVYGKGRPGIIRGMDMNAKVPDEYMIPIENLMNPRALDFHAASEFIYFADATSYIIGRQKIDGTERDTILKEGESETMSLAQIWGLFFLSSTKSWLLPKIYAKRFSDVIPHNFHLILLKLVPNWAAHSLTPTLASVVHPRYSHSWGNRSRLDGG